MRTVERVCAQCGTPLDDGTPVRKLRVLCDDICTGAWLDHLPSGHFRAGASGPLCTDENPCDLHARLARITKETKCS